MRPEFLHTHFGTPKHKALDHAENKYSFIVFTSRLSEMRHSTPEDK